MKTSAQIVKVFLVSVLAAIILSSCLKLRPITLYDGEKKEPPAVQPESIEKVVSPVLFVDDTLNIWGIVDDSCKSFNLTQEVKYAGDAALKLNWNRAGCEWIGFGMGWDDYAGKNLEPILNYAAFQMYVRTQNGKAYGLPMVFTLEDYSGVMAFCYTANKYFDKYYLDENWQKVQIPLSAFDDEGEGIDYSNIKQLQIEMQQAGSFYVDEISLVFYEEKEEEPWLTEPQISSPNQLPQVLFDDNFVNKNGWGLVSNQCMTVERSGTNTFEGDYAIHAKWDIRDEACALPLFGLSWAKWTPVDVRPMKDKALLSFYVKSSEPENLSFQVLLEDFNRNTGGVNWRMEWVKGTQNGWHFVNIPLSALLAGELQSEVQTANASDGSGTSSFQARLNPEIVKTLAFKLQGSGEMWIDQMKWIEIN